MKKKRLVEGIALRWDQNSIVVEDHGIVRGRVLPSKVRDLRNFIDLCLGQGRFDGWRWFDGPPGDYNAIRNACLFHAKWSPGEGLMNVNRKRDEDLFKSSPLPLKEASVDVIAKGSGLVALDHPNLGKHWVFVFEEMGLHVVNSLLDVTCARWSVGTLRKWADGERHWLIDV